MGREHGTRAMYVAESCRCAPCREANRRYYHKRKEWVNGYEPAPMEPRTRAMRTITALRKYGLGYRSISTAAELKRETVTKIHKGQVKTVHVETRRKLEEVLENWQDHMPDGALVDAAPTWRLVDRLLAVGWTEARIARELGYRTPKLQFGRDRVLVRTARRIKELAATQEIGKGSIRCEVCGGPLAGHPLVNNPCRPRYG